MQPTETRTSSPLFFNEQQQTTTGRSKNFPFFFQKIKNITKKNSREISHSIQNMRTLLIKTN